MPWLETYALQQFLIFSLVFARIGGLMMTSPIYGTADVPARVRAQLTLALALLITPLQGTHALADPGNLINYAILLTGDMLVGVTIGVGITLLFSGLQVAGQVIGQMSGVQLAEVFSPGLDDNVPVFSQLLYYVALAVFVILDGHRQVLAALLDTFSHLPPGGAGMPASIVDTLTTLAAESFMLGVQAAAPAMTALLLATLVLGLIGRTLPQLNVMNLGFGFNILITLGTICFSLGTVAWIFQEHVGPMLTLLVEAFHG